jgi:hypothetical protein
MITLIVGITFLFQGCASINSSSRDHISSKESYLKIKEPIKIIARKIKSSFSSRGMPLTDKKKIKGGVIYKFKGNRAQVTTVTGSTGDFGGISSSSAAIGSVYLSKIVRKGKKLTSVSILGKPTVNNKEVCSDYDFSEFKCDGATAGLLWPGRAQSTGKEEAEVVKGVLLELSGEDDL